MKKWNCSQFGARERYAIPRALHLVGNLQTLYTDIWTEPGSLLERVIRKSKARYHPDLQSAMVANFNEVFLYWKLRERLLSRTYELDAMYDSMLSKKILKEGSVADIFFGYSYSSRKSLKAAHALGYKTLLGQINPGPVEAQLVVGEYKSYDGGRHQPFVPDENYWDLWREEVSSADKIIVNSNWSKSLLLRDGIPDNKMVVIPLAFEEKVMKEPRRFVSRFDHQRSMRLLYLGGLELRKGFHILIDAMRTLKTEPVHLDVVGTLKGPNALLEDLPNNVSYHGAVSPGDVARFYHESDVFIFPTLSDGFGLTLLEAQARQLPVISSANCAPVIEDHVNGLVLEKVDKNSIRESIMRIIDQPDLLPLFSSRSASMEPFSLTKLAEKLEAIQP